MPNLPRKGDSIQPIHRVPVLRARESPGFNDRLALDDAANCRVSDTRGQYQRFIAVPEPSWNPPAPSDTADMLRRILHAVEKDQRRRWAEIVVAIVLSLATV